MCTNVVFINIIKSVLKRFLAVNIVPNANLIL